MASEASESGRTGARTTRIDVVIAAIVIGVSISVVLPVLGGYIGTVAIIYELLSRSVRRSSR